MEDAKKVLESLNADELQQRLEQLNGEREATLILLRAANRMVHRRGERRAESPSTDSTREVLQ